MYRVLKEIAESNRRGKHSSSNVVGLQLAVYINFLACQNKGMPTVAKRKATIGGEVRDAEGKQMVAKQLENAARIGESMVDLKTGRISQSKQSLGSSEP